MKLEEVIPHLRAGGRVKVEGYRPMNLEELTKSIHVTYLFTKQYEIVTEPLKIETKLWSGGTNLNIVNLGHILNILKPYIDYKVTIEEIKE